jgi:hypothetical protein
MKIHNIRGIGLGWHRWKLDTRNPLKGFWKRYDRKKYLRNKKKEVQTNEI